MGYLFWKAIKFEVLWHFSSCFLLYQVQSCPSYFKVLLAGIVWKNFVLSSFQFVIIGLMDQKLSQAIGSNLVPKEFLSFYRPSYSILVLKFLVNFPSGLVFLCSIGSLVLKFQETSVFLQRFKCFLPIFVESEILYFFAYSSLYCFSLWFVLYKISGSLLCLLVF